MSPRSHVATYLRTDLASSPCGTRKLCGHVATIFRGATFQWQGILQLLVLRQVVDDFLIPIYVYFGLSGLFLLSQRYVHLFEVFLIHVHVTCMFMPVNSNLGVCSILRRRY